MVGTCSYDSSIQYNLGLLHSETGADVRDVIIDQSNGRQCRGITIHGTVRKACSKHKQKRKDQVTNGWKQLITCAGQW